MELFVDRFSLENKNVVVTGASSGIGRHFAGVLAEAGANVVLGARRLEKVQQRVDELCAAGGSAVGRALDVLDGSSITSFLDAAESAYGPVDIVINNAGVESGAKIYTDIDEEDWDRVLNTNLKSVWQISKMFTKRVIKNEQKGGNIINVTSTSAYRTIKGQFPYAVSKAALVRATEVMALEGARYGIRVNSLAPGYILTDVSRGLLESERGDRMRKGIPMRRYGTFEDLDGPLLLLASDASSYMSGATLVIDGGHICAEL